VKRAGVKARQYVGTRIDGHGRLSLVQQLNHLADAFNYSDGGAAAHLVFEARASAGIAFDERTDEDGNRCNPDKELSHGETTART
jgi:hypothetical protein